MPKYTLLTKTEEHVVYEEAGEIESAYLPRIGEEIFYMNNCKKRVATGSYKVHWVSHNIDKSNLSRAVVRAIKNKD